MIVRVDETLCLEDFLAMRTRREAWSVDRDVPWASLDFRAMAPSMRSAMAGLYGLVLQAERLGLRVAQRLVETAPEGALRDFGRIQAADEARHVEFFARVSVRLGPPEAASPALLLLERDIEKLRQYESIMLHGQVMENAAIALLGSTAQRSLRMLRSGVRLPGRVAVETLLAALIRFVRGDEAAHVAFGLRVLRNHCAQFGAGERREIEAQVRRSCALMQATVAEVEPEYRRLGFRQGEVAGVVARAQEQYWRHLSIDPGLTTTTEGRSDAP